MPFVSVPIIVSLGIFVVLFIIVLMFREQIAFGLELAWEKLKSLLGLSKPAVQAPSPQFAPEAQFFDQGVMEKILPGKKEVFNIAKNKYTYSDAEPLCKAFGAELATYDQVKDAWQKGADWCNYGWVKGQMAVYPTQEATYQELQQGPEEQRGACGRPGLNGGYFDNPEMKFGVTCSGRRPPQSNHDASSAAAGSTRPLSASGLEFEKKVQQFKTESDTMGILPFNKDKWGS